MTERVVLCGSLPPFPPLPPREPCIPPARAVRIADLDAQKKRRLWAWMKSNDSAAADLLASQPVRDLIAAFPGASPVVDIDYLERALS